MTDYSRLNVTVLYSQDFEALREAGCLAPETPYKVDGQFAWSPDGIGVYWYESFAALAAEHF